MGRATEEWRKLDVCVCGGGGKMRRKQEGETDILELAAGERGRGLLNELECTAAAASPRPRAGR